MYFCMNALFELDTAFIWLVCELSLVVFKLLSEINL
jgi:hypothetical protein